MQLVFHLPRPSRLVQTAQARTRSLDIDLNTIHEVLRHYGLELIRPRNLPLGRRSQNVIVLTTAGKKVLKRYRKKWQLPAIVYGHSILTRLADLDFPAPRLVATADGSTFVGQNGRQYALFDFVEGTNYASSYLLRRHWLRLAALAGQTLARFHHQLSGFVPEGQHHLGFISYNQGRHREVNWYVEQLQELKEKSRSSFTTEVQLHMDWLAHKADWMIEALQALDKVLQAAALPRLIIHGDYAIQNLLFQRDGAVTPMDFELARLEWRLSDLVTTLIRFGDAGNSFDLETMRTFVTSYQAEYPLSAEEWQHLPDVWQFRRLKRAVLSWQDYFQVEGAAHRLTSARKAVGQAQRAINHRDALLALNPRSSCDTSISHLTHTPA